MLWMRKINLTFKTRQIVSEVDCDVGKVSDLAKKRWISRLSGIDLSKVNLVPRDEQKTSMGRNLVEM